MDRRNGLWADPARVDRLRALWAKGLSCRVIAQALGISIGAVVSKAHRIGLSRPSPIQPRLHPLRQGGRQRNNAGELLGSTLPPLESERR